MSDYTKATNFAGKDALSSGDPQKIIKGSEIDAEYNAIAAAISSKADLNGPTFTGTPSAPTASTGTASTQIATTAFVQSALVGAYPVGSIYMNATVSTNPGTLLGFGTWTAFGAGRILLGDGGGFTAGGTGGSADAVVVTHTHTAAVTDPTHSHTSTGTINYSYGPRGGAGPEYWGGPNAGTAAISAVSTGITVANSTEGVSGTNANLQPYIVVYMWKRTL